jgi:hypothetical protein
VSEPDLTEFVQLSAPRKRKACSVGGALGVLKVVERGQLEAALGQDNALIGSGAISKWLERRGFSVNTNQVTAHRRGQCACGDA